MCHPHSRSAHQWQPAPIPKRCIMVFRAPRTRTCCFTLNSGLSSFNKVSFDKSLPKSLRLFGFGFTVLMLPRIFSKLRLFLVLRGKSPSLMLGDLALLSGRTLPTFGIGFLGNRSGNSTGNFRTEPDVDGGKTRCSGCGLGTVVRPTPCPSSTSNLGALVRPSPRLGNRSLNPVPPRLLSGT